jgi:very-short-patch-repair endonuclease
MVAPNLIKNLGKYAQKGTIPWNKGLRGFLAGEKHYNWKGGITTNKKCPKCKRRILSDSQLCWKCYLKFRDKKFLRKGGLNSIKILSLKKPTSIEKILYEELKRRNLSFIKQYNVYNKFLVDAYIPNLNLIVEADGKYWHNMDRVKKKDKSEDAYLLKCGFNLLRLKEEEILSGTFRQRLEVD